MKDKGTGDLFDFNASQAGKESGMALAASHAVDKLIIARTIARKIALDGDGTCDMDQVGKELAKLGITVGPWCGSVFKSQEDWQFTGHRSRSERKTNHARELKVWRYIGK